ncbi:MAG: rhodanese-like domain-containing protein [Thermodesulfobacteriota bacterium]
MKSMLSKLIPFLIMASFLATGCTTESTTTDAAKTAKPAAAKTEAKKETVYKGKVVQKSNKNKLIVMLVGKGDKAKKVRIKFDDKTTGAQHATPPHAAIIKYEMRNGEPWAVVIKPKLAKLPKGVTEIKTEAMEEMIYSGGKKFTLIDSRPGKRYAASFIPTAISIPVPKFKELAPQKLPKDKDAPLVFYCGGPT